MNWSGFLLAALAASFSPGPGVLLAVANGPRRAVYSSIGNACGIFLIAALAMTGVGLLLRTSPLAFGALKLAGAAYLIYLGLRSLLQSPQLQAAQASDGTPAAAFKRGLLVALSNPKAILFFSAVFPQFMQGSAARFVPMVAAFLACTFLSHGFYVVLTSWAGPRVLGQSGMRYWTRCSGLLFIALGAVLLLQ